MISLKSIDITGFKNPDIKAHLDFGMENLTLIYGENGVGKTTLLGILHAFLAQDEKKLFDEKVSKIRVDYFSTDELITRSVTVEKIDHAINQSTDNSSVSNQYDWSDYENSELYSLTSLFFGVERGISTKNQLIDEKDVFSFLKRYFADAPALFKGSLSLVDISRMSSDMTSYLNMAKRRQRNFLRRSRDVELSKKNVLLNQINIENIEQDIAYRYMNSTFILQKRIQKALFDSMSHFVNDDQNMELPMDTFDSLYIKHSETLLNCLDDEDENDSTFMEQIITAIKQKDVHNSKVKRIMFNLLKSVDEENIYLSSINTLIEEFNKKLSNGKKLVIEDGHITVVVNKNSKHQLNELSSGEKHLLSVLCYILFDDAPRDIIAIDEPEISLNMTWQRELIPMLKKILPNTQIILATHSASIVNDNTNNLAKIVRSIND